MISFVASMAMESGNPQRRQFSLLWQSRSSGDNMKSRRKTCSIIILYNLQQTNIINVITIIHSIGAVCSCHGRIVMNICRQSDLYMPCTS